MDASKINTTNKYNGYMIEYTDPSTIPDTIADGGVIRVYYTKDEIGGFDPENPDFDTGDQIPDKYQVVVRYVAGENGSLEGETFAVYDLRNEDVLLTEIILHFPNPKANSGYQFGKWIYPENVTVMEDVMTGFTAGNVYTFTAVFEGVYYPPANTPTLNKEDHTAYIIGYEDGTVRPGNNITRAEVATIFFRLLTDESRAEYWCQTNAYSDVNSTDWFNNAVSTLGNAGIITGYPDGTFRPNAPITRAEFSAIAARFSDVVYNGNSSFTDVAANHWAARYITLAEYLGWVTGYPDGSFHPDQAITRAEAITLINRVLERETRAEEMLADMVTWSDSLPTAWYYEAVQEATNSHTYSRTDEQVSGQSFNYEQWHALLENPDWAALEKSWSTANSN
ncbi:MAG: S-layer homology domain-containing protein [Oscillospiraceae bacterium]|nr:S-layer homology domain-containing protein [Oscillospiraceae bacterium]